MKAFPRLVTWLAVPLLAVVAALAIPTSASAAPACELGWRVLNVWPASPGQRAGFVGEFTITNTGDTASYSWYLSTRWPFTTTLAAWWNGLRVDGTAYDFVNYAGAGLLRPGESTTVGVTALEALAFNPNRPSASSCHLT